MYCYLEFKLRYLKNLKLFSIRVKELFEPIVLRIKRRRVFALFIIFFLRNQSLSNARWFYGKKHKIRKDNLYLTENWLERNEIWFAEDNHSFMCHICAKRYLNSILIISSYYWQNINFNEIAPNFTFWQKSQFFKYNWNFLDQLLLPYKFHGRDMWEILFSIFASCEPLIQHNQWHDESMNLYCNCSDHRKGSTYFVNRTGTMWLSSSSFVKPHEAIVSSSKLWNLLSPRLISNGVISATIATILLVLVPVSVITRIIFTMPCLVTSSPSFLYDTKKSALLPTLTGFSLMVIVPACCV